MKKRTGILSVFCLAAGAMIPTTAPAKVARTSLAELVRSADAIVVARVEAVPSFDGLPVARAVPTLILKGKMGREPLHFVAGPTWSCDTSKAVTGETALLFLDRATGNRFSRKGSKQPSVRVPAKPLFTLTHAGRGRMPLRRVNRQAYIVLPSDVELPKTVPTFPGTGSERTAVLGRAIGAIRAEVHKPNPSSQRHSGTARSAPPGRHGSQQ